ncbi:hypothetical protein GCM10027592_63010 [Spirosoma flavus]
MANKNNNGIKYFGGPEMSNNILVIGGPNAGKTHFGGQLYGRLMDRSGFYSITTPPEDLTVFREVLDCLSDGKSAGHTSVDSNTRLELNLEDAKNSKINFSFPDYGGEQIQKIVNQRKINDTWKQDIEKCDTWMLFIRQDEILPIEDVINRGLPDKKILKQRESGQIAFKLSEAAYFIELLQILLYIKKVSLHLPILLPRLTIVLSCWDLLLEADKELLPSNLLENRLPMLARFIKMNWAEGLATVIGLSSTGKTLSDKVADKEFRKYGPEAFGYFIAPDGKMQKDLTLTISIAIGN